jgi:hypothetical protein
VNYFFPQLVAQAAALGVIALCVWSEARGDRPGLRYLFIVPSVFVLEGTHLLPTVEIVAFLYLSVVLDCWVAPRALRLRRAAEGAVAVLAASLILWLHPGLAAAVETSANDGGLELQFTPLPFQVALLAVVVSVICLAGLTIWVVRLNEADRRNWAYLRVVCVFGLAIAGCCLAQYAALQFGYGSPYAVKKYAFGLNTLLVMLLALAWSTLVSSAIARTRFGTLLATPTAALALVCIAPVVATGSGIYTAHGPVEVARLAQVDEFARSYRSLMQEATPGKYDEAYGVAGIPGIGNRQLCDIDRRFPRASWRQLAGHHFRSAAASS